MDGVDDVGSIEDAGVVNVIHGSVGDQLWHQDISGVIQSAEVGDGFGTALP